MSPNDQANDTDECQGVNRGNVMLAYLVELGCCSLCCLRYLGERAPGSYRNPLEALSKRNPLPQHLESGSPPSKLMKKNVCTTCLGLLQEDFRGTVIQKVIAEVNDADFDCREFSCALSMPVSFSLRTHSMNLHMNERFPADEPPETRFVSVKDVWKWIATPTIAQGIHKTFNSSPECDFSITICISYEDDEKECTCLLEMHKETYEIRKKQKRRYKADEIFTRKSVETLLQATESAHFQKFYPSPPDVPNMPVSCSSVTLSHNSLFVAGRYNKFSRKLSQTPWIINGKRLMESSVEELICNPIIEAALAQDHRFSSSGREDVDVRMLGRGRPFFCELINPRRVELKPKLFRGIEESIATSSKDVAARHLQIVSKDQVAQIKMGEEEKIKMYSAYCIVSGANASVDWERLQSLPSKCPIILHQKTPIRVLHRRSLATRQRAILKMEVFKAETKEPRAFVLNISTQAGTYVKEFVHGDFGRTTPNLRDLLGTDVDILALDVKDIDLDWPPEVCYDNSFGQ